jgi:hypothetical protein
MLYEVYPRFVQYLDRKIARFSSKFFSANDLSVEGLIAKIYTAEIAVTTRISIIM